MIVEQCHWLQHSCVQQPHGIWQLASRACPAAFVSNPAAGQQQLQAITPNGTQTLRFGIPGKVRALLSDITDRRCTVKSIVG